MVNKRFGPVLAVASTLAGGGCGDEKPDEEQHEVIVVGAGVAGLTTARWLADAGHEVVVLEARDRVGGRVFGADLGGVRVDMGAAWLIGADPTLNPVAAWLVDHGFTTSPAEFGPAIYDAAATEWIGAFELDAAGRDYLAFTRAMPELREALGPGASVGDGITTFLDAGTEAPRSVAEFAVTQGMVETQYAAPTEAISLEFFLEEGRFPGSQDLPDDGFATSLVDSLAEGVDVRLEHGVTG